MPIGTRIGARVGNPIGTRINSSAGASNPLASVARDATSGIYYPATVGQWATVRSVAGVPAGAPTSIWSFQDTSGGIVDTLGVTNLGEFGSVLYNQSLAGHERKFCGFADGSPGSEFASLAASLPDLATDDVLVIFYLAFPTAPAGARSVLGLGNTSYQERVSTTPSYTIFAGGGSAAGAANLGTAVRPHLLRHNRTAGTVLFATDQEKSEPAFDPAVTGKRLDVGGFDAAAANMLCGYGVLFTGAAARLTNAEAKAVLNTVQLPAAWSP